MDPRVIVMPVSPSGGRQVRVDEKILGVAFNSADLLEFLRRAGLDTDTVDVTDPELVDWREGGPESWA
ncbi:hypothetical protein ABZ883_04815 [Streptomyces sp. NPDC046977]|uniref:hypothetical protein n=1 Tax=Streptomyces sp. NPDC046977 TaxID=3154703 RepID=UPI0033EDDA60